MTSEAIERYNAIAAEANRIADRNTTTDWSAVALNAASMLTLLTPVVETGDTSKLALVAMHDDWLGAVAGLPMISTEGLAFIAKAISGKGWVSCADALKFLKIEEATQVAAAKKMAGISSPAAPFQSQGTAQLLARAEAELPGTIERFAAGAKEAATVATDVLAFTAKNAILVGKGLGATAKWVGGLNKKN